MSSGTVQVAPDSTGKKIDTSELVVGANVVERQRVVLGDDATAGGLAKVSSTAPAGSEPALVVRNIPSGTQPVSGSVDVASLPSIAGTVAVSSMPTVEVSTMPAVSVSSMPTVDVATLPAVEVSAMPALSMTAYTVMLDDVGGGVSYVGAATPGSATSASVWRIKRIVESSGDIAVSWADGTAAFAKVWDSRAGYTYS